MSEEDDICCAELLTRSSHQVISLAKQVKCITNAVGHLPSNNMGASSPETGNHGGSSDGAPHNARDRCRCRRPANSRHCRTSDGR